MQREALVLRSYPRYSVMDRLYRGSRIVLVRVFDSGHEVDSFQASSAETLRDALRPVYRHLPRRRGSIQFTGVEERWLPLDIRRFRREITLSDPGAALAFLAG